MNSYSTGKLYTVEAYACLKCYVQRKYVFLNTLSAVESVVYKRFNFRYKMGMVGVCICKLVLLVFPVNLRRGRCEAAFWLAGLYKARGGAKWSRPASSDAYQRAPITAALQLAAPRSLSCSGHHCQLFMKQLIQLCFSFIVLDCQILSFNNIHQTFLLWRLQAKHVVVEMFIYLFYLVTTANPVCTWNIFKWGHYLYLQQSVRYY